MLKLEVAAQKYVTHTGPHVLAATQLYGFCPKMIQNCYGLWGMKELWIMFANPLHTNLGIRKSYGLLESMGYLGYGLRGRQL